MIKNDEKNKVHSDTEIQGLYQAPTEQGQVFSAQNPLKPSLIWISIGAIIAYFMTQGICISPFVEYTADKKISNHSLFMGMALNAALWIGAIIYFMPRLPLPKMAQTNIPNTIKHIITGIIYIYIMLNLFHLFSTLLEKILGYTPELQDIAQKVAQSANQHLILLTLTSVILIPIVEELLFRGLLYRSLKAQTKPVYAAILSAALFALVHGEVRVMPQLFALGLIFTYFYEKNGSLAAPVLLHSCNNLLAVSVLTYS